MPIAKLELYVTPHSLNKKGNGDYCIMTFKITVEGKEYFNSTSLYSKYILENEFPKMYIEEVINNLKQGFITHFDLQESDIDYLEYDVDDILNDIKKIKKETVDKQ